jgi:DNA-directed RNA polymerase subunit delta
VRTDDTIYLVKISTKLSDRMVSFDDDDDIVVPLEAIKGIHLEDEEASDDDDEIDLLKDDGGSDDSEDNDDDDQEQADNFDEGDEEE